MQYSSLVMTEKFQFFGLWTLGSEFVALGEATTFIETLRHVVSACILIVYFEFENIFSCKVFVGGKNYSS